jgi:RNA-directed DNA polymerase
MNWSKYEAHFREAAREAGYGDDYVISCLSYAQPLFDKGVPIIFDQEHLAHYVGYSVDYLRRASNSPPNFYREFTIPKKSGGYRKIAEPLPSLKEIQRWVLDNILYHCKVSEFSNPHYSRRR